MPQGNSLPYGNAFLVHTPALDNYSMRLYNEHRLAEQQAFQENLQLDNLMKGEIGKIRAADTPEFLNQWEQYKNTKRQLYNPKIQRNAQQINDINQQANQQLSKAMQLASDSAEFKARQANLLQERTKNPLNFTDDFNTKFEQLRNTPMSSLAQLDHDPLNDFYYQGNVTKLQPILDKAKGTVKPIGGQDINENYSPLQRSITTYKGGNSPTGYASDLMNSLVGQRAQKDFLSLHNFTPEEEQQLELNYNQNVKNNPDYIKAYGANQLEFSPLMDASPTGHLSKLLAMEYALDEGKPQTATKFENKTDAVTADREAFQLKKQQIGHQNSIENIKLSAYYNNKDPQAIDKNVDGIIQTHLDNSKALNGEVPMSTETFKALTGEVPTKNSVVKIDNDGNYTYGKRELDANGKPTGNILNEKTVPYVEAKTALTKAYKGGLSAKNNTGTTAPTNTYSDIQEQGIQNFMKVNKLPRDKAIQVLKQNGRLK